MNRSVLEVPYIDAEEFISNILLNSNYWLDTHHWYSNDFVFRGERTNNPEFKLLPSALRESIKIRKYKRAKNSFSKDVEYIELNETRAFIQNELQALYNFYKIADRNGFALPEVKTFVDYEKEDFMSDFLKKMKVWLPSDILEIAGMAQHYGVPTRLLDWSHNPLTALYFAAMGAIDYQYNAFLKNKEFKPQEDEKIVIWALNYTYINLDQRDSSNFSRKYHDEIPPIAFVHPPYNRNPNLAAQTGLFTHWETDIFSDIDEGKLFEADRTPLDDRLKLVGSATPLLIKFTLPVQQSHKVLKVLERLGHNASKLFPGLGGVAKELNDKQRSMFIRYT